MIGIDMKKVQDTDVWPVKFRGIHGSGKTFDIEVGSLRYLIGLGFNGAFWLQSDGFVVGRPGDGTQRVIARVLARRAGRGEMVKYRNGDRLDPRLENLYVVEAKTNARGNDAVALAGC